MRRPHPIALVAGSTLVAAVIIAAAPLASSRDTPPTGGARRYGTPVAVGRGHVRTYVVAGANGAATEVGLALDEGALEGLPPSNPALVKQGHDDGHMYAVPMPNASGTPFQYVQFGWNPSGHEPPGVYDVPHFDFHFYTVPAADVAAIVKSDPQWAAKAERLPNKTEVPDGYAPAAPPGVKMGDAAVPMMGLHWASLSAVELQKEYGHPEAYKPFTATFIYGSWNGRMTFWEPMITRAHILAKKAATDAAVRDQVIPIPMPTRVSVPGLYPKSYRITWDAQAKEYRVALTDLIARS